MLGEWFNREEREAFLEGLERLDALARKRGASGFAAAGEAVQVQILSSLEREAGNGSGEPSLLIGYRLPSAAPRRFFTALKELVLVGYYTSQVGATQELHWNPVPGSFQPCLHRPRTGDVE
jgi:hypothetical protein